MRPCSSACRGSSRKPAASGRFLPSIRRSASLSPRNIGHDFLTASCCSVTVPIPPKEPTLSRAGTGVRMRPSSSPAPYWLFELAEVEGRRVGKLLLCQITCELRLAANLDLIHGHGNQLVADAEEAADRE